MKYKTVGKRIDDISKADWSESPFMLLSYVSLGKWFNFTIKKIN